MDECTRTSPPHPCKGGCQNKDGGFTCTCPDGKILDTTDLVSCNGRWKYINIQSDKHSSHVVILQEGMICLKGDIQIYFLMLLMYNGRKMPSAGG